jgi:ribosome maturation factor RimP
MNNRELTEQVRVFASPVVESLGYELIETEYTNESGRWILRFYIDVIDGAVTLGDCQKVSKTINSLLDVEDIVPGKYNLEVSSPGENRPIRREKDFEKFIGSIVKVRTQNKLSGRRNFMGTITGVAEGVVTILEDANKIEIPIDQILKAHLQNES